MKLTRTRKLVFLEWLCLTRRLLWDCVAFDEVVEGFQGLGHRYAVSKERSKACVDQMFRLGSCLLDMSSRNQVPGAEGLKELNRQTCLILPRFHAWAHGSTETRAECNDFIKLVTYLLVSLAFWIPRPDPDNFVARTADNVARLWTHSHAPY